MKDGSLVEGEIISENTSSINVKGADGKTTRIKRDDIMRILYTKLKMGKIYIQKRDGEGLVAYMVDEDQETYTFRKDLYKPQEFVLNRNDVLFIAEKNPSGLKVDGETGTGSVSLVWLPPYDAVKKYNIYIKKDKAAKYELAGSTKKKYITLDDLNSNTAYYLVVTSVDMDDYESPPSNELKITTKNIPPDKPVVTAVDRSGDDRNIRWTEPSDPDGKIVKYRIYGTRDDKRTVIAEINKTEYLLKAVSGYDRVELTAVDDRGDESLAVKVRVIDERNSFSFRSGVIVPLGKFGEMAGTGYGGMIGYSRMDFPFTGFDAGLSAGFYYVPGKDLSGGSFTEYDSFMIAPVLVNIDYRFSPWGWLAIVPSVSAGASYIKIDYLKKESAADDGTKVSSYSIDPTAEAGLGLEFRVTDTFLVAAYCGYGMFFEESGTMGFVTAGAALQFRF